ncbi:glutathione S-transferase-like isoform X1 [Strigops habroptila]|uniref:glutathione S-transferase-like isoform X1 n=2 Tax=Strigops habroptila TaxID=2489341 RepID=UPI0011CF0BEC|nr:glutathione S-transferase-like isoform X1 [Strigops habroptila]
MRKVKVTLVPLGWCSAEAIPVIQHIFKTGMTWMLSQNQTPTEESASLQGNKKSETMAGKPKLHYSNGRGRMESIRWLLATAGVEFEEQFIEKKEDLEKLRNDGYLLFQQVPMVEIDGMKMVQTRAIGSYIAAKYNLYGKDLKERAWYSNSAYYPY